MTPRALLPLLALAATVSAAAAQAGDGDSGFRRQGLAFTNPGHNNHDIVRTADGRYRAYFMDRGAILSAVSEGGRRFKIEEGVRVDGGHPAVMRLKGGRVRIYFSPFGEPGLRSAISSDGLDFEVEPGLRLKPAKQGAPDSEGSIHPSAVRLGDGRTRIYYDAVGESEGAFDLGWNGVMSATSDDGLRFTRDRGMRLVADDLPDAGMVWSPFVRREGRRWALYVSVEASEKPRRNGGIWRLRSRNGLRFARKTQRKFFGVEPGATNVGPGPGGPQNTPQDPFLLKVKRGERLFYWEAGEGTYTAFRPQR